MSILCDFQRESASKRPLLFSLKEVPLDTVSIEQARLDLANRARTNPFPWRGQFSPELVELLLARFGTKGAVVLDPYAGIGTTLVEAVRQNLPVMGIEINPAAVLMAETYDFIARSMAERHEILNGVLSQLDRLAGEDFPLFGRKAAEPRILDQFLEGLPHQKDNRLTFNIMANTLIRWLEMPPPFDAAKLFRAFNEHRKIILGLPVSSTACTVFNADARLLPLEPKSIDLVVTSPPYINVFNYHQNNRKAMELLGWDLLAVARSEVGANRKHRGNRFMTVVQYCLDIAMTLGELHRVMKRDGHAIVVIGRESNVRGVAFSNAVIFATLARDCGFAIPFRQERKFVSRFGTTVFEDILHIEPISDGFRHDPTRGRDVARRHLEFAVSQTSDETVVADIKEAIFRADAIAPSPLYDSVKARRK